MDIPESMEIDTLETFDALVAPRRLQLLEFFSQPGTAKAAAEQFDVPVTRLYYHINTLLDHGTELRRRPLHLDLHAGFETKPDEAGIR